MQFLLLFYFFWGGPPHFPSYFDPTCSEKQNCVDCVWRAAAHDAFCITAGRLLAAFGCVTVTHGLTPIKEEDGWKERVYENMARVERKCVEWTVVHTLTLNFCLFSSDQMDHNLILANIFSKTFERCQVFCLFSYFF